MMIIQAGVAGRNCIIVQGEIAGGVASYCDFVMQECAAGGLAAVGLDG
jgi:hypothetical protein